MIFYRPGSNLHGRFKTMRWVLLCLSLLVTAFPSNAGAQAFCALRDPHTAIGQLFPEATTHRSMVRRLGPGEQTELRRRFSEDLPNYEFGEHTVYAVFRDNEPLGVVHVRSEKGTWGLLEIAWALDLDLRLRAFRLQRGYEAGARDLLAGPFPDRVAGLGLEQLSREKALGLNSTLLVDLPEEQKVFAATLLQAAPRAIAATRGGWQPDLAELRALAQGNAGQGDSG